MSKNKWAYIYGDECGELWEHFGMPHRDKDDRMKVQLIDFQPKKDKEEQDNE